VGEELQGAEAVHKSRLAGARMAGRAGPAATQDGGERGRSTARWIRCSRVAMEGMASFTGTRRSC
jgi:hypothetical protein